MARVRERREALNVSQRDLAAHVGISRQALGAIEAGRSLPAVDVALRIAEALHASAESLFGRCEPSPRLNVSHLRASRSARRVLASIRGRWVAHELGEREHDVACDGLADEARRTVALLNPLDIATANVIVMGCAPALGILSDRLNGGRGSGRFVWLSRTSKEGIAAVAAGDAHVAGLHLTDDRGGSANAEFAAANSGEAGLTLVTLAHWEVGLATAKGNPKRVTRASDVARRGVRLVNRERGASPRRVLERRLRAEGTVPPRDAFIVRTHRDVARAVALGAADVGPTVRDVTISFDLGFVPFGEERFDLAIPPDLLARAEIQRLLDALASSPVRAELSALGYDVRDTGKTVEVGA